MILATYAVYVPKTPIPNGFPARIAELRKDKGLTQQQLAERVGVHVQQLKRYEAGISQPTLDVIRNLAIAFDADLKLQFEAVSRFDPESKKVVQQVLDSMILQQEARRWSSDR
jgi:transcriptional regulator with XRE-family HTH domain